MSVIDLIRDRYRVTAEPQRSERRLELIVLALILVISLQVLWFLVVRMGNVSVAAVAPAEDSLRVVDAHVIGAITGPQSRQLRSRPVFWASRRPNANAAAPPPRSGDNTKPARRLEDLQVAGAVGAGDQGRAIIIYKDKLMRLGLGDKVAGWSLQSVSLQQVVFVSAGARDVRRLTPLPVVAAQATAPRTKAGGTSTAAKAIQGKNNKTQDKLSAGGQ